MTRDQSDFDAIVLCGRAGELPKKLEGRNDLCHFCGCAIFISYDTLEDRHIERVAFACPSCALERAAGPALAATPFGEEIVRRLAR
jgi:hypothetical protein